ncbi:hypothetical protein RJ639_028762 [Escallonia herrerae]|uniref:CCHC-type domain-containing protein n=1 Tax=Escallonia herrerae TaxID=1293975 RepID=A0AA88X619_9ASTE|nr:hypothetical protein RJ639_028762 [Escallonia herrerae]
MMTNNAIIIGRRIDDLQQIDSLKEGKLGEKGFLRLRVEIDIENPLPKGFSMEREGREDAWIQFRYERLLDFCFRCGCLGHVRKWCNKDIDPTAEWKLAGATRPYFPWIQASYEGDQAAPHFSLSRNQTQEIGHSMQKKKVSKGLAAIKINMEKAYNKMEWAFILFVLKSFGFYNQWIQWVDQCINTASMSILINGAPMES